MFGGDVAGVAERCTVTGLITIQQQYALPKTREAKCAGEADDASTDHHHVMRAFAHASLSGKRRLGRDRVFDDGFGIKQFGTVEWQSRRTNPRISHADVFLRELDQLHEFDDRIKFQ